MSGRYDAKRIETLSLRGDAGGLLEVLEHGDLEAARRAGHALARMDDRRAVEPLLRRLRDFDSPNPSYSEIEAWGSLAHALSKLQSPDSLAMKDGRAAEPMIRLLSSIDLASASEEDIDRWSGVADALGEYPVPEAIDPLIAALPVIARDFRRFYNPALSAVHTLGEIGDPRAVPALAALLEPEPPWEIGNDVWNALEQIGTPEAQQAIEARRERDIRPPDLHEWVVHPIQPPLGLGRLRPASTKLNTALHRARVGRARIGWWFERMWSRLRS